MKLILLVLLSTLIHCSGYSQQDTLSKYSYPLLGFDTVSFTPAMGTCFFIKIDKRVFLVTARHVITGCGVANNTKNYPEIFTVITGFSNSPLISINVKGIKNHFPCPDTLLNDPDIIAVEVNDSATSKLNSVEQFIKPPFRETDYIDMYGFPGVDYLKNADFFAVPTAAHIRVQKENTTIYTSTVKDSTLKIVDSSYYTVVNKNLYVEQAIKGYSGSPVFIKELYSNQIRLLGVFATFGYDTANLNYKYWGLPKFEYVFKQQGK